VTKLSVALGLARFAWGVRRFCRDVEAVPHALETVRARVRDRERRLLATLERTVFGRPRSPYASLLRAAGCEPGDVERLVLAEGVDGALQTLRHAGVYVSFEEFKGLVPAVRGSQRFEFRPEDFDNPLVTPHLSLTSGGSRARPTRILVDLDYLAELTPSWAAFYESHGWMDRETIFVTAFYPTIVNRYLRCARIGKPYDRWFVTARGGSPVYALATRWIHWTARRAAGSPAPSTVALDRLEPVVAVLAEGAARAKPACVHTSPTTAARLAVLAIRLGRSLAGVAFCFAGEPYTDARRGRRLRGAVLRVRRDGHGGRAVSEALGDGHGARLHGPLRGGARSAAARRRPTGRRHSAHRLAACRAEDPAQHGHR
jgi:hypothetical protein